MKYILVMIATLLTGCWGYSSTNSEAIAQVKKVDYNTPLVCDDYVSVDLSMGVMRNGVGSMSSEDVWFYVESDAIVNQLKEYAESGKLVRVTYSEKRWRWCVDLKMITKIEEIK